MSRNVVHGIQITADVVGFQRALLRAADAARAFALAMFCDGEAAAELWCRHHPSPVGKDYSHGMGREYHRRSRARARRRR